MKKLIVLLIVLVYSSIQLKAQNYFEEFGKISQEEIDMKKCSFDPSADAVVLFDVGKSSFVRNDNGFDVVFTRITRIKILTEAGKKFAEVSIPFYQEGDICEKVSIGKANTYTIKDGKISNITVLDQSTCYEEKVTENWKDKKFAMPDIRPGSIVEFVYSVRSQYLFNLRNWEFQWDIPVLYSEYEVRMIPFYEYSWLLQGRKSIDDYKTYEDNSGFKRDFYGSEFYDMVYKFGLKNIPAFNEEEYISSREDDIVKIDFQLAAVHHADGGTVKVMTTWPELVSDYLKNEDFGRYIRKSENNAMKALVMDSMTGKTPIQKFNYILDYAKDHFKCNSTKSQFAHKSVSDFLKDKIGNSAEINLWLVGAMHAAGLDADAVLLSTRKHGKIKSDYPFSSAFNFVIAVVRIDGKPYLADATDPYCPNGRLPIECINDKGLTVSKENMQWFSLQTTSGSNLTTTFKIDSIGRTQSLQIVSIATDYEALFLRNTYGDHKEELLSDLNKKNYSVDDSSLRIRFALDRTRPYAYMYNFKSKSEISNDKIYLMPFLNEVFSENPLKQKTRTYPVDIKYPVKRTYKSEITVPEGYKVEFLPAVSSDQDDLFGIEYKVTQNENTINVDFTYEFKHAVYSPEEYSRVKAMFDRIVKKGNEKIVLARK